MMTQNPKKIVQDGSGLGPYVVPYELWYRYNDPTKVTEPWIQEQKNLVAECEVKNKEREANLSKRVGLIRSEIKAIYGEQSKIFKYTKNALSTQFPRKPDLTQSIKNLEEKFNKHQQSLIAEKQKEVQEQEVLKITQEAILFLTKNGKQLGKDFQLDTAISEANSLCFNMLVEEKIKEGGPYSFGGDDNCEDCEGWDGGRSRSERTGGRCQCGNRRVSWESSGDFRDMYVYGQAW
jgi:hypothetical protein